MKQNERDDYSVFSAHLMDLCWRRDDRDVITASDFLTEAEQKAAEQILNGKDHLLFGGFEDAERRIVVFLPGYYALSDIISEPKLCGITYLNVMMSGYDIGKGNVLTNRDVLGTVMSTGIKRESIGDIASEGGLASVAVKDKVADFLHGEIKKIGGFSVDTVVSDKPVISVVRKYIEKRITVSSPRLDGIIAGIFDVSRDKAAEYVRAGLVSVNGDVSQKTDRKLEFGDTVSLRGKGKARIRFTGDTSRKGRDVLIALIYS